MTGFRLTPLVPKEANIQAAAIQALLYLPGVQGVLRLNGGFVGHGASKRPSYRLFRRGDPIVSTGFPDLLVFVRNRPAVLIEMKRPNTLQNVSEAQDGVLKWAGRVGIPTLVASSWEAVSDAVRDFIRDGRNG
jgi:hypothetical protein